MLPPSRRQPGKTPPVRRPRVAGTRKATDTTPAAPPAPKPRPSPAPRPQIDILSPLKVPERVEPPAPAPVETPAEPVAEAPVEDVLTEDVATEPVEQDTVDALTGEPESVQPSPRRKIRDTGIRKPQEADEATVRVGTQRDPGAQRQYVLAGVLVLVGLLLAGAAVFFKAQADGVSESTSNTALLDVAKTAQVKDQVSKATEALFSYDFNNIKKTEDAANDLLVNDEVRNKYNALIGQVKTLAPQQKIVVTCKVTRSAVVLLNGDLAKVMVFIDQTSTRTDTKKTTAGSAQLHVNAQLQGDKWKITDMDTYNVASPTAPASQAPPPSPAPSK